MLIHDRRIAAFPVPDESECSLEAANELKAALRAAYEEALDNGMSPGCAFQTMLDWLARELQRVAGTQEGEG
jgi:hypothetical protein